MYYYAFRVLGLSPKYILAFRNLKLHKPKDLGDCVIETLQPTRGLKKIKKEIERLLELLQIFYLGWITYFGIYRRKSKDEKWELFEATSTYDIPNHGLQPFYSENYIKDFIEMTFGTKRFANRIHKSNILLIDARIPGVLFETKFLLRWLAFESLIREEKGIKQYLDKKQFLTLKKMGNSFAQNIRSTAIRSIFIEKINRARGDLILKEAFEKYMTKKKLPICYDDIKDCKNARDEIAHFGSIADLHKKHTHYHNLSMKMESLVRNLIMHYLDLKFDSDFCLSEWVPFEKSAIRKNEQPVEWHEPVQIFTTTQWFDSGQAISIERLYPCPENIVLHVGLQAQAKLGFFGSIVNRINIRARQVQWTTTCIVAK